MTRKSALASTEVAITYQDSKSWLWIGFTLALLALFSFGLTACSTASAPVVEAPVTLPSEISVDEAYQKYEQGVFFLDVRTPEEWDDFHAPNSTQIPLDQLENRLDELPEGEQIVVICRSGNRSQVGRDILLSNGFESATSMSGGLKEWMAAGYPIE